MFIIKITTLLLFMAASNLITITYAANLEAGKQKALLCSGCHGQNGISPSPQIPNLAGQKAPYLVKQLKDFKSGYRKDGMMKGIAANLNEQDMEDLSAYYESLNP